MEQLLSSIVGDLFSRALSMVIQRYWQSRGEEEDKLHRLHAVLLRIHTIVEEAEGRHITNQAMLQQLHMLREGMYRGYYMLDSLRYRAHRSEGEVSAGRSIVMERFIPSRRPLTGNLDMAVDVRSSKDLEKMLGNLEGMMSDMEEFVIFLESYPRFCRQPYSPYLVLDKVMFGRQMEKERIISFLLMEAVDKANLGVLPIIGPVRVGKSTLVEHVCLDERVRGRFSSIVFLSGQDLDSGNLACLSGVIKHQNPAPSCGESLVVIELAGGMDEGTWRRLYSSAINHMAPGSKIILTSASEKISAFGTTRALTLNFLPKEAYWYFFQGIAFGSTNPEGEPKLAEIGMKIAELLKGSFVSANLVARLLQGNLNYQFWRRVLQCVRDSTNKNILLFGEHPIDLRAKGRPVYCWTVATTRSVILVGTVDDEDCSSRRREVPMITAADVLSGSKVLPQGKFEVICWKSVIPPYHTYLASCVAKTSNGTTVSKKRSRQQRA